MADRRLATLVDLEQILQDYGGCPEIVYAVAAATRYVDRVSSSDCPALNRSVPIVKVGFLLGLLGHTQGLLGGEDVSATWEDKVEAINAEVVDQLIGLQDELFVTSEGGVLHYLISFLGEHEPFEGISDGVRRFLYEVVVGFIKAWGHSCYGSSSGSQPALAVPSPDDWEVLAKALLRYEMFAPLRMLVRRNVYDILPALFEGVRERVDRSLAFVDLLVRYGWSSDGSEHVVKAFREISDARVLRLLLDLAQAYMDEYGKPFSASRLF